MPGEFVSAVVTALTVKGAETLVIGGRDGLVALVRLVRSRLSRAGKREVAVLEAAMDHPDDQVRRQQLGELLARTIAEDPEFRERLHAAMTPTDNPGTVVNRFSGSAEKVVQARDIHGNITF